MMKEIVDERDDLLKANQILHALVSNRDAEIERLRSALTQFVACCDTSPPTSLIIEIGMACKVARDALALPQAQSRGEA